MYSIHAIVNGIKVKMRLIDTHAHLSELDDKKGVISRASEAGIEAIIGVGTNLKSSITTLNWANEYKGYVYPAIGIHPSEIVENEVPKSLNFIKTNIRHCVAVGEIGLDYWYKEARKNEEIRKRQRELFTHLLTLAESNDKPASVHSRGAWEDALELAGRNGPERIVFHWYSGPLDILRGILDSGFLISATPAAEFSKHLRAALTEAPIEKIIIETDSPVSYHGKRAEPSDILLTLKALADLKGLPMEDVAAATTRNAEDFFQI